MTEKEPLRGGEPVRGGNTSTIAETGYNGKIPVAAITSLEWELTGLVHGTASITLHVRDGKLARFETERRRSHLLEEPAEGKNAACG